MCFVRSVRDGSCDASPCLGADPGHVARTHSALTSASARPASFLERPPASHGNRLKAHNGCGIEAACGNAVSSSLFSLAGARLNRKSFFLSERVNLKAPPFSELIAASCMKSELG